MGRHRNWKRLNARSLDRRVFGPVVAAFEHVKLEATFLLHLKFVSRNHPRYRQDGMWAVVERLAVVRRKLYRLKAINKAPTAWANAVLRLHAAGVFERVAAERAAAREPDEREWREAQAARKQRMTEVGVEMDPFERWLRECYERRIGPVNDEVDEAEIVAPPPGADEIELPVELRPYEDDRKKRHRSVINYHLPPAYDELPSKLVPLRRRTLPVVGSTRLAPCPRLGCGPHRRSACRPRPAVRDETMGTRNARESSPHARDS